MSGRAVEGGELARGFDDNCDLFEAPKGAENIETIRAIEWDDLGVVAVKALRMHTMRVMGSGGVANLEFLQVSA